MTVVRWLPLLALCAAIACGCPPFSDRASPGVHFHGTPSEGSDRVLAIALERWPDLRGVVGWIDPGTSTAMCGAEVGGCTYRRPECGDFSVVVERLEPATASALAHELAHAAGADEEQAVCWAEEINAQAAQ